MLAIVDLEERVPQDHPLLTIKCLANEALGRLSPRCAKSYRLGSLHQATLNQHHLQREVAVLCVLGKDDRIGAHYRAIGCLADSCSPSRKDSIELVGHLQECY